MILEVSDTGAITGGSFTQSGVGTDTVTGGQLAISGSGAVSGSISYAVASNSTITGFQMSPNHEVVAGTTLDADDYDTLSVAIVPEPNAQVGMLAALGALAILTRGRKPGTGPFGPTCQNA